VSGCEKCKDAFIFHRDYKRGDNKKVFSHSDIIKGIEKYEKKIDALEKELQAEREKSEQQFDLGYKHGVREGRGD